MVIQGVLIARAYPRKFECIYISFVRTYPDTNQLSNLFYVKIAVLVYSCYELKQIFLLDLPFCLGDTSVNGCRRRIGALAVGHAGRTAHPVQ